MSYILAAKVCTSQRVTKIAMNIFTALDATSQCSTFLKAFSTSSGEEVCKQTGDEFYGDGHY